MARVSRITNRAPAENHSAPCAEILYNTALYARLSVMDTRDRKDSESLETQTELLKKYMSAKPDMSLYDCYKDNGETGTNFDRPGFQRMMNDVRAGRVNCIIVKDLSRFGRNFLETGNFLEKVLPFLGVRFIAVNDGYDSLNAGSGDILSVALKNLINDIYAKDISAKVCSALDTKKKNGEFIGNYAAYGYLKDPADKHRLIIDKEAAEVVKRIFQMKDDGLSNAAIARKLTAEGVPNPNHHRYLQGIIYTERFSQNAPWGTQTVINILQNPVYLGHMAQGKKITKLHENKKQRQTSASEWIIVENTHEPIIQEAQYERVQSIISQRLEEYNSRLGRYDYFEKTENIFKGLVFCGCCGKNMVRYKEVYNKGRSRAYCFICPRRAMLQENGCENVGGLREEKLKEIVFDVLERQMELLTAAEEIIARVGKSSGFRDRRTRLDGKIAQAKERRKKVSALRMTLFENYVQNIVTSEDFSYMSASYEAEEKKLEREITLLEAEAESLPEYKTGDNKWYAAYSMFRGRTELSALC